MKLFLKKGLLISLLLQGCISYEKTPSKNISFDLQKDLVPQNHYVHGAGLLVTLWNSQIFYKFNLTTEEKLLHQQAIIYSLNLDTNESRIVSWSNFDQSAYGKVLTLNSYKSDNYIICKDYNSYINKNSLETDFVMTSCFNGNVWVFKN
jgi:hypothetical protein